MDKLVVETRPGLGDGGGVGKHTDGALNLSKVATRHRSGCLVVNADFEASWTPIDELDRAFCFDVGDGGVNILGHDVASVQQTTSHVLAMSGVALDHLIGWIKTCVGDVGDRELLVVRFLGRDDGRIRSQWEMDTRVRNQVRLKLGQVHIQRAVEAKRSGD